MNKASRAQGHYQTYHLLMRYQDNRMFFEVDTSPYQGIAIERPLGLAV